MTRRRHRISTKGRLARGSTLRNVRLAGASETPPSERPAFQPPAPPRPPTQIQPSRALEAGAAHLAAGRLVDAQNEFQRAHQLDANDPVAMNCLGIVHRLRGDHAEAIRLLERAIELRPTFAEAFNNLGNTRRDQNELAEAERCFRRAIELNPALAESQNNLGVLLLSQGEIEAATELFRTALRLNPEYAEATSNLGNALRDAGNLTEAADHYTQALRRLPDSAEIHNNLGNIFSDLGDPVAAQAHYEHALSLDPSLAEARKNLGTVMVDLGDYDNAIAAYHQAATLEPDSVDTIINLGNAYKQQGWLDDAKNAYERAAELEPHNQLHQLRIAALCPAVFSSVDEQERYRRDTATLWKKISVAGLTGDSSLMTTRLIEPAFGLQFLDGNIKDLKEAYASIFADRFPQRPLAKRTGKPKIGFVVTLTHEGIFVKSMKGIIEQLPDSLADLVIVCPQASVDMLRDSFDRSLEFVPLPRSFSQIEQQMHEANLDVLYYWEIGTDATNYFLPFLRLAPVQCTSWGVQVTSGIPNVDYYISSSRFEPEDAQEHYSEQLLLVDCLPTYQYRDRAPTARLPREAFGFRPDQHIYLCSQQLGKFHPDFDETLGAILRRDPHGVFVAIEDRHATARAALEKRWKHTLPDVAERATFVPRQERPNYVNLLLAADVLLDPPHFGGVNSSYDAFTFGKPLITEPSGYHRGRYTLGCYREMGFSECVVSSRDDYVEVATGLGTNSFLRRQVEEQILAASEVLFEDQRAVHEHERIFRQLIDVSRSGGEVA